MNEEAYLVAVRKTLDELGSADSSADITGSGEFWKHCRHVGLDPKVCAATIYTGERHRHEVARTVIKENVNERSEAGRSVASRSKAEQSPSLSSEVPTHEQWEVVIKRAGVSPDDITSAAGRRPDEVTAGNAVFAGFKDDEKAASFAKKMTKAGYISSFGPRRDYTLHEKSREQRARDIDEHALEELDLYIENTAELYPQKKAILRNIEAKIARGSYDAELAPKLWLYWVDAGAKMYAKEFADERMWKVIYPKSLRLELARRIARREYAELQTQRASSVAVEEVAAETSAAAEVAVEECASCIPWQKVSRDANAAAANTELAKKYGAIKNAKDVYRVVGDAMNKEDAEVFLVIPLDLRGELKAPPYEVARGQYSHVAVGVENVMAAVYAAHCEAFIVCHNHPSGRVSPSAADKHLTESISDAVKPLGKGVTFVDHCIIGSRCVYSISEKRKYTV